MICKKCNCQLDNYAKYCKNCGSKVDNNEESSLKNEPIGNQKNMNTGGNPEEILSNLKSTSVAEKVLLVIMIIYLIPCIALLFSNSDFKFLSLVFLPMILIVLIFYLDKKNKKNKYIQDVDMEHVKSEILRNCYSYSKIKTYFTDNYIITNYYYGAIIKYEDILWIYPIDKYVNDILVSRDLSIMLKKGKKVYIPEFDELYNIIISHNPNVLIGATKENEKMYNSKKNS